MFVGAVQSRQYVDGDEYLLFRLRVSRVLRGSVDQTALVYSSNDSGRVLWEVGKQYVVFAQRANGRLMASNDCGPLSESVAVPATLRHIEALRSTTTASVEGEVLRVQPDGAGVPGVVVRVRGGSRTFEAKSDDRGRFQLQLPPGSYQVLPDPKLRQTDYNLGTDPSSLRLVAGQCAQLQYVTR